MQEPLKIAHYLDAYREEALALLYRGREERNARGLDEAAYGYYESYPPPEIVALESFIVLPLHRRGLLIYGVPRSAKIHEYVKITERHGGIFIGEEPEQHGAAEFRAGLDLDLAFWSQWWPPISRRDGFLAFLARNALVPHFDGDQLYPHLRPYRSWRHAGECFSVIACEELAALPDPGDLARRVWAHLRIERRRFERNVGSFGAAASLAGRLEKLLSTVTREEELQLFLEDHPEVIAPDYIKCFPKLRLASEYVTDFVILRDHGYEFVEIERPDKPVFTKRGQFHHLLTQAENQVLDWQLLLQRDFPFFERRLPGLHRPSFRLIYGRDRGLDGDQERKLRSHFTDIRFDTYDSTLRQFQQTVENLLHETRSRYT